MTQQPTLHSIRRRLARLGRARRAASWLCGLCVALTTALWALAAIFAIDVLFQLDVLQRVTVFGLAGAICCWVLYRFVRPYFRMRETEADLALLVEGLHGIDSDLVAAIEFSEPAAISWGSAALRGKVIHDTAIRGEHFEMARGIERGEPLRRTRTLLITVALAIFAAALFPQHLAVFLQRLALADHHYPSRTVISAITINDRNVFQKDDGHTPRMTRCPERRGVAFSVRCTRAAPPSGELRISPATGGSERRVPLVRQEPPTSGTTADVVFTGQLPTLLDSLQYRVYLGDAWTNPATIEMIPLPQVEIHTTVTPPAYTGAPKRSLPASGTYRMTVLEGSQVELAVSSGNKKDLRAVSVELQTASGSAQLELSKSDGQGRHWTFDSHSYPPLNSVQDTVRFAIHATDHDGLQPLQFPTGEIRVQSDLPPDAAAATIHTVVLPEARPQIAFRVHDDFGIGRMRIRLQVERQRTAGNDPEGTGLPPEVHWLELDDAPFPIPKADLPYDGLHALALHTWKLNKGDRIKVTLETTDHRGPGAGASVMSKPLYLEISDRAGVLAAILEADHRTEKDLDEMIQRQLGLGESP